MTSRLLAFVFCHNLRPACPKPIMPQVLVTTAPKKLWHVKSLHPYAMPLLTAKLLCLCRYLSHFRSVHRGAYFAELRTTTVRKLMPEAWGFLCPVHTPDGSPCGLLNHFSAMCRLVTKRPDSLEDTEVAINMVRHNSHAAG